MIRTKDTSSTVILVSLLKMPLKKKLISLAIGSYINNSLFCTIFTESFYLFIFHY
jgi:hypothetical protein